jgi:hypothetical protein
MEGEGRWFLPLQWTQPEGKTMKNLIRRMLGQKRWSDLAVEIYERQVELERRQRIARITLGAKWAAAKERATPHKRVIEVEFYAPGYPPAQVSVEFGPPPMIKVAR